MLRLYFFEEILEEGIECLYRMYLWLSRNASYKFSNFSCAQAFADEMMNKMASIASPWRRLRRRPSMASMAYFKAVPFLEDVDVMSNTIDTSAQTSLTIILAGDFSFARYDCKKFYAICLRQRLQRTHQKILSS